MLLMSSSKVVSSRIKRIEISMPDVRPTHDDQYFCTAHRLPVDPLGQYIVGINPRGNSHRVHHMLMYGCLGPGVYIRDTPRAVWDCSEMNSSKDNGNNMTLLSGPICRNGEHAHIMYGWAMDAPALKLPDGVGFKVGGFDTEIQYLVLQVHYGHTHEFQHLPDLTDNSGIILDLRRNDMTSGITKQAGVLLLVSIGTVPQGKSKHEIWCEIDEPIDIHPFRFRVHTHKLGTKVLGAKLDPYDGNNNLVLIGQHDPQQPQMFYPVEDTNMTLGRGDQVYASCEYNNNLNRDVDTGQTGADEMCNFYLMYWTNSPRLLAKNTCTTYNY